MLTINGIPVDVFEDSGKPDPAPLPLNPPTRHRYDLFVDDPVSGERLWIYTAGTAVESARERSARLAPADDGPAVTSLTVWILHRDRTEPEVSAVYNFPHDVRGRELTFRFARPFAEGRLRIEADGVEGLPEGQPA